MCSSTVSFGLMVTRAASIDALRSAVEMSDFSGLSERSRQTASVKKWRPRTRWRPRALARYRSLDRYDERADPSRRQAPESQWRDRRCPWRRSDWPAPNNRIETGERSGGIGEICSVEVDEK